MQTNSKQCSQVRTLWTRAWMGCLLMLLGGLISTSAWAQRGTGTISGTVQDAKRAVIPNATVTLENAATADKRQSVSNGTGFFNFAAVGVGTYKISISAPGFNTLEENDIVIHAGDDRLLPELILSVAGTEAKVEVTASDAGIIPTDSGSSSTTIGEDLVENISIQGRDAAEMVKFMPGMGMNAGLNQSEFSSQTTSTNSGPIGQFSANGTQPYGGMQMTLDGAGMVDIGNMGTQIANVNQDTTAEFTYLNAAFGADTPRGPTIIQVTSKSGGQKFHGDGYIYGRDWQMNSNEASYKAQNPGARRPMDHQMYPGGTIGGPVVLPHFGYNKNHDKLFFFAGFEKMLQNPFPTTHYLVTPTANMIAGDFSTATLPGAQNSGSTWWDTAKAPCSGSAPNWTSYCGNASQSGNADWNGGKLVNKNLIDSDGLALLTYLNKVNKPNIDPATHNGYNFRFQDAPPVNRWELRARGDYNPTTNDKLNLVYTQQNEADINNFGIWWQPGTAAPLPSPVKATTLAKLWTANYTHIFSATSTNEFSFSHSYFTYPPSFESADAMKASTAGFTNVNPFGSPASNAFDQIPNLISWNTGTGNSSGSFSSIYAPPMIKSFGNAYGNVKKITSLQDNFTKVIGRHSLKAGFFWDNNNQLQTTGYGSWSQGMIEFDPWSTNTTGNEFADMLIGHTDGETQAADAPSHNMAFHEYAFYAQDSWRVGNKLTLNYGVRFDHDGAWYPLEGKGIAVFDPAAYAKDSNNNVGVPTTSFPGMRWHEIDSSVPKSGFKSPSFQPDVRVGAAYDLHGNGRTVLRGGFGMYRWQFSEGDVDSGLSPSWNVINLTTPSTSSMAALKGYAPSAGAWCALNSTCPTVEVIKKGDDQTPYTQNWDVMIDQELPYHLTFEAQYIGNHTRNALFTGNGSTENFYSNINRIPMGGLFGTYSLTGADSDGQNLYNVACAKGSCATPDSSKYAGYRPYKDYGVLNLIQHGSYSNYHGIVAAVQKQTGAYNFLVNYTFSKVLGIRDGQSGNGAGDGTMINPFSLRDNYGVLAYDHTHIFNAMWVLHLPAAPISNSLVKSFTKGWDLSGDLQVQSGAPIQPNTGGELNVAWQSSNKDGNGNAASAGQAMYLGTNARVLMPVLKCDPRKAHGLNFNTSCFVTPSAQGQTGQTIWPYIKGPVFNNADVAVAKTFKITESQNILFRASSFNFMNHALPNFGIASDVNLKMGCSSTTQSALVPVCDQGGVNVNTGDKGTTGKPGYESGRRVIELALKYNF